MRTFSPDLFTEYKEFLKKAGVYKSRNGEYNAHDGDDFINT